MSTNQTNNHVNFIVHYTVLKGIGGSQKRKVEISFHHLSTEVKENIINAGIGRLVNWKPFQDEMIRLFANNNHFVRRPIDWSNLFFVAETQDGGYFDRDVQVDEIYLDTNYDKRIEQDRKMWEEDLLLFQRKND